MTSSRTENHVDGSPGDVRPNISGTAFTDITNAVLDGEATGAFSWLSTGNSSAGTGSTIRGGLGVAIDASRVSSIFDGSSSVQPMSVRVLPCIKF